MACGAGYKDGGVWHEESFGFEFWRVSGVVCSGLDGGVCGDGVEDGEGEEDGETLCSVKGGEEMVWKDWAGKRDLGVVVEAWADVMIRSKASSWPQELAGWRMHWDSCTIVRSRENIGNVKKSGVVVHKVVYVNSVSFCDGSFWVS